MRSFLSMTFLVCKTFFLSSMSIIFHLVSNFIFAVRSNSNEEKIMLTIINENLIHWEIMKRIFIWESTYQRRLSDSMNQNRFYWSHRISALDFQSDQMIFSEKIDVFSMLITNHFTSSWKKQLGLGNSGKSMTISRRNRQ